MFPQLPRELYPIQFEFLTDVELARCSRLSRAHCSLAWVPLQLRKKIAIQWRSVHIMALGVRTFNPAPPNHEQVQIDELNDTQVCDYIARYTKHLYLDDCKLRTC